MLQLTHADNVSTIKEKLLQQTVEANNGGLTTPCVQMRSKKSKLQVVEVWERHVSRSVEDWTSLKYLKDKCEGRMLYVIEIPPEEEEQAEDTSIEPPPKQGTYCSKVSKGQIKRELKLIVEGVVGST